jgi:hypothetical protein
VHVCTELVNEKYFAHHKDCIPNDTCDGQFGPCNRWCPEPNDDEKKSESDRLNEYRQCEDDCNNHCISDAKNRCIMANGYNNPGNICDVAYDDHEYNECNNSCEKKCSRFLKDYWIYR